MFDYSKLRGKIKENYHLQSDFAKELGVSAATLTAKLNNQSEFTQSEMIKSVGLLKIEMIDIISIFFTEQIQKSE